MDEFSFTNSDYFEQIAKILPPKARMNQHNNDVGRQVHSNFFRFKTTLSLRFR